MFEVKSDSARSIISFQLEGLIREDEINAFVEQLQSATQTFAGQEIKIRADLRGFRPASQAVAAKIAAVQEFGIKNGVKRVAEIVESTMVALQLNRVAKESGTDKILRRFSEEDAAFQWLMHGD